MKIGCNLFLLLCIITFLIHRSVDSTTVRELGDHVEATKTMSESKTAIKDVVNEIEQPASTALAAGPGDVVISTPPPPSAGKEEKKAKPAKFLHGKASFYDYRTKTGWSSKGKLVCASRDFLRGTMLLVTNIKNGKQVVCKVTDYGPNIKIHPDRIIDLSSAAFSKIGSVKAGILSVTVENSN